MKYIFITGGVVSSLGKGVIASSLGRLLHARGYNVTLQKLNLYYNALPSLLSPLEHGEAFITDDGTAVDLDLGNFERFVDVSLTGDACSTTGMIHKRILERELSGEYHGETIQAIPHVADEIKACIREAAERSGAEISIVEIGGTVGDMEADVYLEAIRQMRWECEKPTDCCYLHTTLMPYIVTAGELKTKPTQSSVKMLRSMGIQPDVIVCRTEVAMTTEAKDKIALFCNVKTANVIQDKDVDGLYQVPLMLEKEGLAKAVLNELKLENRAPDLTEWKAMVQRRKELVPNVHVALVGKYTAVPDAYLSVTEALRDAGLQQSVNVSVEPVDSEKLCANSICDLLAGYDAIVVPGGFGGEGTEGMVVAAKYARENRVPFLAIGQGMQMAVVEAVRNLVGYDDANSVEADPNTPHPVTMLPTTRVTLKDARLGGQQIKLIGGALGELYGAETIRERHSNRYEMDARYMNELSKLGFRATAVSVEEDYLEAFEMDGHPFYEAVLFHPEYISRPNRPHPLFVGLIEAAKH